MRLPTTPATTLWRSLRDEVRQHARAGRVILAVDGAAATGDGARTAAFANGLADVFAENGDAVFRASSRGFHRPAAQRRERPTAEGAYRDSYDYATMRRVLLDPFRDGAQTGGATGFQLTAFDAVRDTPAEAQWVTAPRDAVLIVDGEFLHRPELRGLWNWSVWLESEAAPGDSAQAGSDRESTARALYLRDAAPRRAASVIVDDSDPDHPVRVYGDFC